MTILSIAHLCCLKETSPNAFNSLCYVIFRIPKLVKKMLKSFMQKLYTCHAMLKAKEDVIIVDCRLYCQFFCNLRDSAKGIIACIAYGNGDISNSKEELFVQGKRQALPELTT